MNCTNCGQPIDPSDGDNVTMTLPMLGQVTICGPCERVGRAMSDDLKRGLVLEYRDGSTEVIKYPTKGRRK